MKINTFKTVEELLRFVKEFEEKWAENDLYLGKTIDINYFKLTVTLRKKQGNRKVENESTTYFYRDMGANDSLQLMRLTEKNQYPSDTKWMIKLPITTERE